MAEHVILAVSVTFTLYAGGFDRNTEGLPMYSLINRNTYIVALQKLVS